MSGFVGALPGLAVAILSVGAVLSLGLLDGTAVLDHARHLITARIGKADRVLQPVPVPVIAPTVLPAASPLAEPTPMPAPAPMPLASSPAMPSARPPAMPTVVYANGATRGDRATATRGRDGHFYFDTTVNGSPVKMMFDTGASVVSLRAEDAVKAGIDVAALRYSLSVSTANGKADAAPVVITSFTVGDITRRNVAAIVARPGAMSVNLLGQSFMSRIAGYRVDGERLSLQGNE